MDGQALAEVLADGRLWGAGLDVTDPEPLPPEHPLWRQPKALITPHTAGGNHLADTERRIARIALDNLRRYLAGRRCATAFAETPPTEAVGAAPPATGERGQPGNVKHGFTARLSRPAQAKGGSGKGGQDTGGELRVGVQRQFEFQQGPVLFLPARAAAAEDKAAVGQAAVVPEQLLLREKVHRGVVVGKVVGHGDDRLLDAGPVGPLLRHHKALPHVLLPGGQRRIGAAAHRIQGGGDRDGVLPRVPDAGDAADGVGVALADPRPQKV